MVHLTCKIWFFDPSLGFFIVQVKLLSDYIGSAFAPCSGLPCSPVSPRLCGVMYHSTFHALT